MTLLIKAYGANGNECTLHGPGAGAEGVWMAADQVEGFFDAPVRQTWDATAHQIGGTLQGMWYDVRDAMLGVHIEGRDGLDAGEVEDWFRQLFVYRPDRWDHDAVLPRIEVTSDMSGTRSLDVQLYKAPDFNPGVDHIVTDYANPQFPLRAGQPFWYEPDVVTFFESTSTSASGTLPASNPTDLPMYPKWNVTRCQATLPDRSWIGPPGARTFGVDKLSGLDHSARNILLPALTVDHGGATVDLEHLVGDKLMIRDASDQNMLGQMPVPGSYFSYEYPSHLQSKSMPVSYTGAPAGGARIELRQPRRWSRPLGMAQS
jgi:hypothetical protein